MPISDIHLDANLVTDTLGHPVSAPPLHSRNISLRQTTHPTSVQPVPLRRSLEFVIANRAAGGKGGRVICRAHNLGMVDMSDVDEFVRAGVINFTALLFL